MSGKRPRGRNLPFAGQPASRAATILPPGPAQDTDESHRAMCEAKGRYFREAPIGEQYAYAAGWRDAARWVTERRDRVDSVRGGLVAEAQACLAATMDIGGLAGEAADEILEDLDDRRGLKNEWRQIEPDIQDEIRMAWRNTIARKFGGAER